MFRIFPILLIAAASLMAQQPAAPPARTAPQAEKPATKPEDKCVVEGKVVNRMTGLPVRKATLTLFPDNGPNSPLQSAFGSETDLEGKFTISGVEPGSYRLSGEHAGFVHSQYGEKRVNRPGAVITLKPSEHLSGMDLGLTPHALIIGKVVDEDGDPILEAHLSALLYTYVNGEKQLVAAAGANTNDLGEYRMYGLAPGKYLVCADYRKAKRGIAINPATSQKPDEDYSATYYPGTADVNSAVQVDVGPSSETRSVDIRLRKTRTARIKGRVIFPGAAPSNGTILLEPRGLASMLRNNSLVTARVQEKGAFELYGVAPGSYSVVVMIYTAGRQHTARQIVDVGASDIENFDIVFATGADLPGIITVLDEGDKALSKMRVALRTEGARYVGPELSTDVKGDKTFAISNVTPDKYTVNVEGMEGNSYVKAVKWGDQELGDQKIDIMKGVSGHLEITISRNGAEVEGIVNNEKESKPATGVTVVLVPEKEKRNQLHLFRVTFSNQDGHFQFKAVPPGDYKLFAWEDIEYGAYQDPEYLKAFEGKGEPVIVKENGSLTVPLKMIPANNGS